MTSFAGSVGRYQKNIYRVVRFDPNHESFVLEYFFCINIFSRNMPGPVNVGSIFNFSDNFLPRAELRSVSKVAPPIGTSAC
jgi:hypothetical protein